MTSRNYLRWVSSFAGLVTLLALPTARADQAAACSEAFDSSQVKRDDGELLESRRLLRICGGAGCLPTQQRLCSEWLVDVDSRLPSVVLVAKDERGNDLVDVNVTIDGVTVATRLNGRALDVDPGFHTFVFERANGARAETTAVAKERDKGLLVSVTLKSPASAPGVTPLLRDGSSPDKAPLVTLSPKEDTTGNGLRTAGLVVGALGLVGLSLGTVMGIEALSTKAAHCSGDLCDPGSASQAYDQASASTVSLVAGSVLLVGGATLWFVAPKRRSDKTTVSFSIAPAKAGAQAQLIGSW